MVIQNTIIMLVPQTGRINRLDSFYQLDYRLHLVGIDSMCFINSTSSGKDRLDRSGLASIPGSLEEFLRRPEIEAIYRLSTAAL